MNFGQIERGGVYLKKSDQQENYAKFFCIIYIVNAQKYLAQIRRALMHMFTVTMVD